MREFILRKLLEQKFSNVIYSYQVIESLPESDDSVFIFNSDQGIITAFYPSAKFICEGEFDLDGDLIKQEI